MAEYLPSGWGPTEAAENKFAESCTMHVNYFHIIVSGSWDITLF